MRALDRWFFVVWNTSAEVIPHPGIEPRTFGFAHERLTINPPIQLITTICSLVTTLKIQLMDF